MEIIESREQAHFLPAFDVQYYGLIRLPQPPPPPKLLLLQKIKNNIFAAFAFPLLLLPAQLTVSLAVFKRILLELATGLLAPKTKKSTPGHDIVSSGERNDIVSERCSCFMI